MRKSVVSRPKWKPLPVLALMAVVPLNLAVLYNVLLGQTHRSAFVASQDTPSGASTRVDVVVSSGRENTVVLKYDPQVEEVQRSLLKTGDYQGMVDGVQGRRTRLAIESYQRKAGIAVTGEVSGPLLDHIHYTQQLAAAADFTGSTDASPAPQNEDADVRLVQTGLAELGYAPGEINGGMNEKTRAAIIQFEEDRGLEPDGDVSPELLAEISKMSGDSSVATP